LPGPRLPLAPLGVGVIIVAVLAAPPAFEAHAAWNSFQRHTILTEWGSFHCSAMDCGPGPGAGLDVYWSPPMLVITRNHVPLVMRTCHPLPGAAWDCRPGESLRAPIGVDVLWTWLEWAETDPEPVY
jgi:hypothetical protein